MARIGINGFGRIGRYLVRLMAERNEFPVVINARADNASLAHLFNYDSVHHTFWRQWATKNGIIINGTHIAVTRCKPNEWQWKDYGVDLVVESTGTIKKRAGLAERRFCGARGKVIMSAPVSDADITIVMGVNDGLYDPAKRRGFLRLLYDELSRPGRQGAERHLRHRARPG